MRDFSDDEATILTVGYEKREITEYVLQLTNANIEVLVDVRDRPLSRKKGFSKRSLSQAVEAAGIKYVHVQALGDPKPGRDAARAGHYGLFHQIFSKHMQTHEAQNALAELAKDTSGLKICLTCFERDHTCCHRSIVAERLAQLTGRKIRHLEV
jgi:uncharacterized protein (DUF488 family)